MITQIFKETDPVYVYPDGWGEVLEVQNDLVKIDFGDRYAYHKAYEVSFTKYDLVRGGFSHERPEPKLEVGKSYRNIINKNIVVINRKANNSNYGLNIDGSWFNDIYCNSADEWQEIPESEAIALLEKECMKWGGENWRDVKIKKCLYDPSHEIVNRGLMAAYVSTSMIVNKNGCIFKDGVWAEKLDEPDEPIIKGDQLIWVRNNPQYKWECRRFVRRRHNKVIAYRIEDGRIVNNEWMYWTVLNPYPGSIEARAIELLRQLKGVSNLGQQFALMYDIDEFLEEIDSYEK